MITKFNTPQITGGSKSGGTSIVTIILVAAGLYLGYRFIVKPMLDKKKEND